MHKKYFVILLLTNFSLMLNAQSVDPLRAKNADAQEVWVNSIMDSLTIDQKIGQLFMMQAYSNKDMKHENYVVQMIRDYHVGNLIFMQGTPEKQVQLTNRYQAVAKKVPLMIGFDGEWGLDMRLKNTYRFPWNMTLGAIQDEKLIEELGERIGEHCKRVGIHINFAPVVDINTNPNNPIIGNRSFGEKKENVAKQSIAFTKGMQKAGVLANAKHFPGHGDTETDSHHTLPVINFNEERIDTLELYPFRKQFDSGVASVMTAHLSIPSLESNEKLPSSLSKNVVTNLLQQKLGFLGLVFTDGLNMKGAANYSSPAEINLAAIKAGNDVLLIPDDIPKTIVLIKEALLKGELTEERINRSVRKILRAKYLVGLNTYKPISEENLAADLNSPKDEVLHRKLIKNSITALKNEIGTIPIRNLETKKIAYVSLGDGSGNDFVNMMKNYTKIDVVTDKHLDGLQKKLNKYNIVIVGLHKPDTNPWKSYKFSDKDLVWLQEIARNNNVLVNVFTSPYSLLQFKSFKNIEGLVVSYQNSKLAQELTAQAIFGAFPIQGKLPVSIKDNFTAGHGLLTNSLDRFQYSIPEDVGMSSNKLEDIDRYIDTILNEHMAPGGQILVARFGKVIYNKSFGYHTNKKEFEVKNSDVYDLASLTKILASLPMVMKAEEDKKISLYSSLRDILPSYKESNKDTLELKEILSHYARLQSWIPFYKRTKDDTTGENLSEYYSSKKTKKYNIKVAKNLYLNQSYKDSIQRLVRESEQRDRIGYKYSDLGYYILKEILEYKYKKPLNKLVDEEFYKSLGLNRTTYLPLEKFDKDEIVPTEYDDYFRHQLVHGYVHDMGAAMLGGVGGHAGLFANANDVAKIMQMYLQEGTYGGVHYFKPETVRKFNTRYYEDVRNRRGLGFDKPQINPNEKPTCGCVSDKSFGHSGFTGTYTWADPQSGIVYVFLSNRVYPNMNNMGLVRKNIRTKIQKVIQEAILQ
ncbi:glycoside hydrolase family 3 N-terminal domain-containing protein [Tenacibaculum sp. IB213877]|uniref:glycoside hydrolase family 3 N-terminal domain-containing protein n=1 Tax=Tenacibaculum sp. IB213877 TaxID=3097351 RepID=UPI002A5A94C5|nr:glycoside hydrolase family 3 N-terminal domain-containing protein [Tenacibaculum sp. IB213877]MDY0781153.1 glycoside hydrolase family 3 N-terminal domain-containing protein [Tenacibaculum sp. IB213877]